MITDSVTSVASLARPQSPVAPSGAESVGKAETEQSFAATLTDIVTSANQDLKRAESMSIAGMKGEAQTHEVVTALMSAEQSLRMAVAVRDKIVQAYLDLSKMQI